MDRTQALNYFWSSFGLTAYDEQTLPDDAQMPYITYETAAGDLDGQIALTGSLWYRSTSWEGITEKMEQISASLGYGGTTIKYDSGLLWITRGSPFAQRVADPSDDGVRRYYMNITANYIGE